MRNGSRMQNRAICKCQISRFLGDTAAFVPDHDGVCVCVSVGVCVFVWMMALMCVWPQSVDWKLFKIGSEQTAFAAKTHFRAGQMVVYGR